MSAERAQMMLRSRRLRRWVVHVQMPNGSIVDLSRVPGGGFPPSASEDEQWQRIADRIERDGDFATMWEGGFFYLANVASGIECRRVREGVA